ncbi:alpha/beta fold hydrolase [Streptoalloteichus hindustanus]|uniref:Pimeloyl-ACP methyl ester carboxylesterase n=1 Tax=Streptoalloteichus hindustanus TaxID=2017 RepID=A0A1M5F7Y3_STRHI|nr:alpha/beta hydrolase [Streptoalloteichus hindustanus]SHF87625.1 Pimeloyl-ACP methyl ester carboxylesterase [Streptoalloteichus hindustanus]
MSHHTTEGGPERADRTPPLGRYYEVGGRRLLLHRSGSGSPTVVFLPGGGTVGLDYLNVQRRAAELTTSVLYDRAGTGWSDRVDLPRGSAEVTDELHELLRVADVPGPYLLVGHSLGGLYARHYATRFPEEVAGLLLLDPAHEDYNAHMPPELVEMWNAWDPDEALPAELPAELVEFYRDELTLNMAEWPEEVRGPLVDRHVSPEWLAVGFQEARNLDQLNDELRQTGPMPDVPLIILTATGIDAFKRAVSQGVPEALLRAEIEGKQRLYTAVAESVSRGENRLLDDAGHATLHWRRPDAVAQAISDLLDTIVH